MGDSVTAERAALIQCESHRKELVMDEPFRWLPWAWLVLAIVFTIAEIFTAGFFLICFGVGALAATLAGFLGLGPLLQFGIFLLVSTLALMLVRPLANRFSSPNSRQIGIDRLLGKEGIVVETIDPNVGHGVVRVDHERWSADSLDGTPIMSGASVIVMAIDGTHLKVRVAPAHAPAGRAQETV